MKAAPLPSGESLLGLVSDLVRRSWQEVDAAHYLDDYRASQWLDPAALRALQMAKLRRLVWHCFLHVPFYARTLGIAPSEIEELQSCERLPLVEIGERRLKKEFTATQAERSEVEVAERRRALRLRAEEWAGAPPARVVAVWGREAQSPPRPLAATEIAALQVALAGGRSVITGPGASLGELASALPTAPRKRFFWQRGGFRVDAIIARDLDVTGGGARLAARTGGRLHKWWMEPELGLLAAPCELAGLHLQADHLLVDVVDGEARPLPNGVVGRLVVTDLHEFGAPFLRQEIARRGRILKEPCLCGRRLPLVELS